MLVMSKFREQLLEELEAELRRLPKPQQLNPETTHTLSIRMSKIVFALIYEEMNRELGNLRTRLDRLETKTLVMT
jgi:hypothetical protein